MYNKLQLKDGDVLSDIHLNHIEDGVLGVSKDAATLKEKLVKIVSAKGIAINNDASFDELAHKINLLGVAPEHTHEVEAELIDIRETCPSGCIQLLCTDENTRRVRFAVWTSDASQYSVDWGDGTVNTYNNGQAADHTYAKGAGSPYKTNATQFVATISAKGGNVINRFQVVDKPEIVWFVSKDIYFTNVAGMFSYYDYVDTYACKILKYVDIIGGALTSTGNVSAKGVFRACTLLERVSGSINLEGATDASYLWYGCNELTSLPDTVVLGNNVNASYMFGNCYKLRRVPYIDFSGMTDINCIFQNCYELEELPADINLQSCTLANTAFMNCKALTHIPELRNSNKITTSTAMFQGCIALEEVYPILDLSSSINVADLFSGCVSLQESPVTLRIDKAENMYRMFNGCSSMKTSPSVIYAPVATQAYALFQGCSSLRKAPTSINLPLALQTHTMFQNCSSLTHGPEELLLDSALDINSLFSGCTMLQTAPPIHAPNATNATNIFYNCQSITTTAEEYSFPSATNINYLFHNCVSLVVAPRLNMPEVTSAQWVFQYCSKLKETKPYTFPKAININAFYRGCSLVEHIEELNAPMSMSWSEVYRDCTTLVSIKTLGSPTATSVWYAVSNANTLTTLPKMVDLTNVVDSSGIISTRNLMGSVTFKGIKCALTFNNNPYLESIRIQEQSDLCQNLNFTSNGLNAEAINLLFGDLVRTTVSRNINIAGNPGASTCNVSIATAKGWTVTK